MCIRDRFQTVGAVQRKARSAKCVLVVGFCSNWWDEVRQNGWMDQDAAWYTEVGLGPGNIVLDVDLEFPRLPPSTKMRHNSPLQFSAHVYCGQTAGWIKMPLGAEVGLGQGHIVPASPGKGTQQPQLFGPCLLWPNGRPSHLLLSSCYCCILVLLSLHVYFVVI